MNRKQPKQSTIKALFAKSGNQCAFLDCKQPLIDDKNLFIGEVCHIHAVEAGGARPDSRLTSDELRAYDNLILLCHPHHVRIDSLPLEYTATWIRNQKAGHEEVFSGSPFSPPAELLHRLEERFDAYWTSLDEMTRRRTESLEVGVRIDSSNDSCSYARQFDSAIAKLEELHSWISQSHENLRPEIIALLKRLKIDFEAYESLKYYEDPFSQHDWELLNLGLPNCVTNPQLAVKQLDLRYHQQLLKESPDDEELRNTVDRLEFELRSLANTMVYHD